MALTVQTVFSGGGCILPMQTSYHQLHQGLVLHKHPAQGNLSDPVVSNSSMSSSTNAPVKFVLPCLQTEWCLHSFQGHNAGAWSGAAALCVLYGRMGDTWAVKMGAWRHAELPWERAHLCSGCGEGPGMSLESACGKWQVPGRTEKPNQSHGKYIRKKSCLLFLNSIF